MLDVLGLIAIIVAAIAFRRTARLDALARRVAELERQLNQITARPAAAPKEDAAEPVRAPAPEAAPKVELPPVARQPPAGEQAPARAPLSSAIQIDWERWIGVRGAAVLGGAVLALAGLFFFRYSIEHGLIPPWLRVVLGTLVGVACIGVSELRLRERYAATANALVGGGIVVLYAAFWAARSMYGLIGTPAAFVLLIAVTAAGCVLSWRHDSLVVALIGLIGGFATPLMVSSGADRPIGLFAYILLLDVGMLYLARQRRWPLLAVLSLAGTLLYEGMWITLRMGPDRLFLGLTILGVFAILFVIAGQLAPQTAEPRWLISQAGGVLLPFAFALYFAASARLGAHLYPTAMLLVLLGLAAGWLAEVHKLPWLGLAAASATVSVAAVWLLAHPLTTALAWEAAVLCVLFALVFHVFVERDPARSSQEGPAPAALVSAVGLMAVLIVVATTTSGVPPWPWLAGWLGLTALMTRHGDFPERERLGLVAALALGVALSLFHGAHGREAAFPGHPLFLGVLIAIAAGFQVVAVARAESTRARWAEHAASLFAIVVLLPLVQPDLVRSVSPHLFLTVSLTLGFLVALSAARSGIGRWLLAATAATALVHAGWTWEYPGLAHDMPIASHALVIQLIAVALFSSWPFATSQRFKTEPWAWYAAALAGPAWFLSLRRLFEWRFGDAAIGLLPLLLAGAALAGAQRTRRLWAESEPWQSSAFVWFLVVALGFITVAIPLQLAKEWITIGWALEGLAVTMLWRRYDHPGLKYFALALLGGATVRLVANPAVLGYYPRPSWRIVNWLAYTYLAPAAALLRVADLLRVDEVGRARDWEQPVYAPGYPVGAIASGLCGLVVIFLWINLAIADWFATGATLQVSFERLPARDLTMSIAWAAYALVLLALGVRRTSTALRWVSLALMMLTIGKVFLYDLGELRDLYRVASLLGLAVSLIVVSLAYQRFVLRKTPAEGT